MLQTDPMKRATAEDIHKHEWFLKDLPTYLFPDRDIDVAVIDHEALATVCEKFSVEPKEIEDILQNGDYQNPLAIGRYMPLKDKTCSPFKYKLPTACTGSSITPN